MQQDRDCARMDLCGGFDHKYGRLADLALRVILQQQSSYSMYETMTVRARTCVVALTTSTVGSLAWRCVLICSSKHRAAGT